MADLDEFFAKKDRKQTKSKINYIIPSELYKRMEEISKRDNALRRRKTTLDNSVVTVSANSAKMVHTKIETENKWRGVTEDHRGNLSDFNFEQLSLSEGHEEDDEQQSIYHQGAENIHKQIKKTDEFSTATTITAKATRDICNKMESKDIAGHGIGGLASKKTAWGKAITTPLAEDKEKTSTSAKAVNKIYIPPAMRKCRNCALGDCHHQKKNINTKGNPDISSEIYFPSLSTSTRLAKKKKY